MLDNVAAGNVSIQQTTTTTTVNQTSQQAIINWQSFNIGANEHTHFQQPSGGVALNRINPAQNASQIYGKLTATGQIILVNPAGIYFGPNAYVNVGGLIATTANISDHDFLNGNYRYENVAGYHGAVVNQGTIIAAEHGLVALVGGAVRNDGMIQAKLGHVVLASGDAFTISFANNDLVSFSVDREISKRATDHNGNEITDGVNNTGAIYADGGHVLISANAAQGVLDRAINVEGVVSVQSVSKSGGNIIFSATPTSGVVRVAAKVNASGKNAGAKGGNITITGKNILLDSGTELNVSGDSGAGNIFIGGDYQGSGILPHANAVVMMPGAKIIADALTNGDGGKVILWSDNYTFVNGLISARGGSDSGNGGFIETSSKNILNIGDLTVDTLAAKGMNGTWLLDPADLTISASSDSNVTGSSPFQPTAASSILNVSTLQTALGSNNVIVQTTNNGFSGNGDITVASSISWSSAFNLTLSAYRNIIVNDPVTITNTGGASVTLAADNTGTGSGTVTFGASSNVALSGGSGIVKIFYSPASFGTPTASFYTGGTTPTAYQLITSLGNANDAITARSLGGVSNNSAYWGQNFALAGNINASGTSTWNSSTGFSPIGNNTTNYTGKFDGQNYTISNLFINRTTTDFIGLFGNLGSGADVQYLTLSTPNITGKTVVGGIFGQASAGSFFSNLTVSGGTVRGMASSGTYTFSLVGGVGGYALPSGSFSNLSNSATVTGVTKVGGILGENANGSYSNLTNTGSINSAGSSISQPTYVGGLMGNSSSSAVSNSSNSGAINITGWGMYVGGVSGNISNSSLTNTSSSGNITIGQGGGTTFSSYAGGLVGASNSNITNSYSTGTVYIGSASFTVGGFVGNVAGGTISGSYATGSVTINGRGTRIGGFAGSNFTNGGNITTSYATGNVTAGDSSALVGGFLGYNNSSASITNSYSTGTISLGNGSSSSAGFIGYLTGSGGTISGNHSSSAISVGSSSSNIGGLVGFQSSGRPIASSYATGNVTTGSSSSKVGGLIGNATSTISSSYATGNVTVGTSSTQIGGLLGYTTANNISTSYSTGSVTTGTGSSYLGGFAGYADGGSLAISNSYSYGNVITSSSSSIGGFAGFFGSTGGTPTLTNGYSTGAIVGSSNTNTGGLIGTLAATYNIRNSFWNTDTSGLATSAGSTGAAGYKGMTTAQMMTSANFTNTSNGFVITTIWDMASVWNIINNQSFPYLRNFYAATPQVVSGSSSAAANTTITVAVNGAVAGTTATGANGFFYSLFGNNALSGNNTLTNGGALIVYQAGLASSGNTIAILPGSNGSLSGTTGLTLTANTVTAGNTGTSLTLSNSLLNSARVSGESAMSYSVDGSNNLTLNTGIAFNTTSGTTYNLDGNLSTDTAAMTFNGPINVTASNSQLYIATSGNLNILNSVNLNSNTLTINFSSGSTANITGIISGNGNLVKNGSGTLTLSSANTFSGGTTILAGTLVGSTSASAFGTGTVTLGDSAGGSNNASLLVGTTGLTYANPIVLAANTTGTLTIGSTGTAVTSAFSGGVTGSNHLTLNNGTAGIISFTTNSINNIGTITNAGTASGSVNMSATIGSNVTNVIQNSVNSMLTLLASNAYSGDTIITLGKLQIGNASAIPFGAGKGNVSVNGTLDVNGFNVTMNGLSGSGTIDNLTAGGISSITIGNNNQTSTYNGLIENTTGSLGLIKVGSGTLTITNAANTYSNGTSINGGILSLSSLPGVAGNSTIGSGNLSIDNGAMLSYTGATDTFNRAITIGSSGGTIQTTNTSPETLTLSGVVTANGNLTFDTAGSGLTNIMVSATGITGAGNITKIGNGTLTFAADNSYSGTTTISNGSLSVGNGGTAGTLGTGTLTNNSALIFNRSDDISYADVIAGTGSLTQAGIGTLTLTGNNNYGGTTTISSGTLQIGNNGTTGTLGVGDITVNGVLDIKRSDSYTISNIIGGTGAFTQSGSGTTTLSASNTYSGGTSINGGVLSISSIGDSGSDTSIGNSSAAINLGAGTLQYTGSGHTTSRAITLTASSGTINASGTGALTLSGLIDGASSLTLNGVGSIILAGNIGSNTSLTSFTTSATLGSLRLSNSSITTTGTQTYNGTFTLDSSNHLTMNAGGAVTLNAANWTGSNTLNVISANNINFNNVITALNGTLKIGGPSMTSGVNGYFNIHNIDMSALDKTLTVNMSGFNDGSIVANGVLSGRFNINNNGTIIGNPAYNNNLIPIEADYAFLVRTGPRSGYFTDPFIYMNFIVLEQATANITNVSSAMVSAINTGSYLSNATASNIFTNQFIYAPQWLLIQNNKFIVLSNLERPVMMQSGEMKNVENQSIMLPISPYRSLTIDISILPPEAIDAYTAAASRTIRHN